MRDKKNLEKEVVEFSLLLNEPEFALKKRLEAIKYFLKAKHPEFRYGISVNLDVRELNIEKIDPVSSLENPAIKIDSKDIITMKIMKAVEKKPELIKDCFMKIVSPKDKIEFLHYMFCNQCLLIVIPEGVEIERPVHIDIKMTESCQFNHLLIVAEPGSKVSFVQTVNSEEKRGFRLRTEMVEIVVKEGAQVNYGCIQNLSQDVFNFAVKGARVERDGRINWIDCALGSKLSRVEISTFLNGIGSTANNWSMFYGSNNQQYDLYSSSHHNAEHTTSDITSKGALDNVSKSVYRGLVKIKQGAHGSKGYQKVDTLLLDEDTESDSIPNLEIDNNDVKCSHGATVGRIDPEKIFYLMSRGLSEKEARKSIVEGFFEPMIRGIHIKEIRDDLKNLISERLENGSLVVN